MSQTNRRPVTYPDTIEGHRNRLRLGSNRIARVLNTHLAQGASASKLGTSATFTVVVDSKQRKVVDVNNFRYNDLPDDLERLIATITLARPFLLRSEPIYGPTLVKSMLAVAPKDVSHDAIHQIADMWTSLPNNSGIFYKMTSDGTHILPEAGVSDGQVADRFMYAEVVKAGDNSGWLHHLDDGTKLWSLSRLVGDILAILSRQEHLLHLIDPSICPKTTDWAGDYLTIYRRLNGDQWVEDQLNG